MSILDPALRNALRTLKLTGMLDTLDARLAQTRDGTLGNLDFLQVLCEDEIARRESAALTRRIRRARFEEQSTFESFDFTANTKLPAAMLRDLAALRWLDAAESVILYGPGVIEGWSSEWMCLSCSGRCCDRCNVGRRVDAAAGQFAP
ncbi:transposase [Mycolicibacterium gilvum]|uniref:Transposase n=1 Tax=Mycolicibacterium gilvum TaxID=1804 RepID=A0A379MQ25_9MYCO|nr:transposase [Mycolicibacterium gilvum]